MLLRVSRNAIAYGPALRALCSRTISSSSSGYRPRSAFRLSRVGIVSGGLVAASVLYGFGHDTVYADAAGSQDKGRHAPPLGALVRSYVVYSLCSVPTLVDYAPTILSALLAVPGLRQLTELLVRVTFFNNFVGGDTAEDCIPVLERLRAENLGCLFAYSVEVDQAEAAGAGKGAAKALSPYKAAVEETIHCIDVAADFEDRYVHGATEGRRTWVALKLTALLPDAEALIRFSKYLLATRRPTSPPVPFPGAPAASDLDVLAADTSATFEPLTPADVAALRELRDDLFRICEQARARGVRIIVDAEHSWYEPAIDAYTLALMRTFNALPAPSRLSWFRGSSTAPVGVQPLVYATHQAYLRREPAYLAEAFRDARAGHYALGVKLVRGAYHPYETSAHARAGSPSLSPEPAPPVWPTKPETDACYDACARTLVDAAAADARAGGAPRVGVLFGSHNADSCAGVLAEMERAGLAVREPDGVLWVSAAAAERVALAQLYGMRDELTGALAARTRAPVPFVIKYVPYGSLKEVIPYLSRRAIENKSVLGGGAAKEERRRAGEEIWKRVFG